MKTVDTEALRELLETEARGKSACVTGAVLRELFGCSGGELRRAVNTLRREGYPIGSNNYGYYYCITREELEETLNQLSSRVRGIIAAMNGMYRAAENLN